MENNISSHEINILDRKLVTLSGINKIVSFNTESFLMESLMGTITLKGNGLELVKLDTHDGNVKIKGTIDSIEYSKDIKDKESIWVKLFK